MKYLVQQCTLYWSVLLLCVTSAQSHTAAPFIRQRLNWPFPIVVSQVWESFCRGWALQGRRNQTLHLPTQQVSWWIHYLQMLWRNRKKMYIVTVIVCSKLTCLFFGAFVCFSVLSLICWIWWKHKISDEQMEKHHDIQWLFSCHMTTRHMNTTMVRAVLSLIHRGNLGSFKVYRCNKQVISYTKFKMRPQKRLLWQFLHDVHKYRHMQRVGV